MSNINKNELNDGTLVNIPMSSTSISDVEEEAEPEDVEESIVQPKVYQYTTEDKTKKKNNEELVSLFRENINKFDNTKLDKTKLEILENV